MRKLLIPFLLACLVLVATFGILQVARGQGQPGSGNETLLSREIQNENTREITAPEGVTAEGNAPSQPQIGFIDSPTAACVQPDSSKNECYLNWYYLSVDASPNYMITMTVRINELGNVARYQGFFQTSMYAPYNMNPQGYKVACGALNSGGAPGWGKAYAYTIRARDSAGLTSANYGTAYCPAYQP
jgi:hypothetical protein